MQRILNEKSVVLQAGDTEGKIVYDHPGSPFAKYFFAKGDKVYSGYAAYIIVMEMHRRYMLERKKMAAELYMAKRREQALRARDYIAIVRGVAAWMSAHREREEFENQKRRSRTVRIYEDPHKILRSNFSRSSGSRRQCAA